MTMFPFKDDDDDTSTKATGLKVTPYERPAPPPVAPGGGILSSISNNLPISNASGPTPLGPAITNPTPSLQGAASQGNQLLNNRAAAAVWGKKVEVVAPPEPVPVVAPPPVPNHQYQPYQSSTPSVQAVPVGVPTALVPELPKQLSQKEIMAQALFSGVGGSSGNNATTRAAARAARRATTTQISNVETGTSSPAPSSTQTQPTHRASLPMDTTPIKEPIQATSVSTDLLDMGLGDVAPVASPSATMMPVFQDLTVQSVAPPQPIAHNIPPKVQPPNISDIFNSMDISTSHSPTLSGLTSLAYSTGAKPLMITTTEFGQRWGQLGSETKQSISCKIFTLDQLRQAMPSSYGHVESIVVTLEAIFAATSMNGSVVLIHTKINQPKGCVDVLVKSTGRDICGRELGAIATAFSSFSV